MVLLGTEVKSIREGRVNLRDSYGQVRDGEVFVDNIHISPYSHKGYADHNPLRTRKLLLHRREVEKIGREIQRSGATCVPLSLYFKGRHVKAQIALVTGKKLHDKRETLRRRESEKESRAAIKSARRA